MRKFWIFTIYESDDFYVIKLAQCVLKINLQPTPYSLLQFFYSSIWSKAYFWNNFINSEKSSKISSFHICRLFSLFSLSLLCDILIYMRHNFAQLKQDHYVCMCMLGDTASHFMLGIEIKFHSQSESIKIYYYLSKMFIREQVARMGEIHSERRLENSINRQWIKYVQHHWWQYGMLLMEQQHFNQFSWTGMTQFAVLRNVVNEWKYDTRIQCMQT